MIYLVWAAALFFAFTWTIGLVSNPAMRLKSNIVAVTYWWISISLCLFGAFSAWQLIWLMPVALGLSAIAMQIEMAAPHRTSMIGVFLKTGCVLGPIIIALSYW